jgi:hypothetical protein
MVRSQPAITPQRLVNSKEWVPAGAMYQPPASLSWHRQRHLGAKGQELVSSLERSSRPFLKLQPGSYVDEARAPHPAREGEIEHKVVKDAGRSPWWNVQQGEVNIRDPSGKFDIFAKAQAAYFDKLSSGHLIRFMFRTPPPASALSASIKAWSGEERTAGYQCWELVIFSHGRVGVRWTTCELEGRNQKIHTKAENVQLGQLRVGEWYVACVCMCVCVCVCIILIYVHTYCVLTNPPIRLRKYVHTYVCVYI